MGVSRAATGLSAIHDFDRALTPALRRHLIGLWRASGTRSDGRSSFGCGLVGVNDGRAGGLLLNGRHIGGLILSIVVVAVVAVIVAVAAVIVAVATVAAVPGVSNQASLPNIRI